MLLRLLCSWVNSSGRPMKESEQTKENLQMWDLDQTWATLLKPAAHLCVNTLDFSDLKDEEDGAEDEQPVSTSVLCLKAPPAPPPLPPPPLPLSPQTGAPIKCRMLKLHWRELQTLAPLPRMTRFGNQTIWASLEPVHLDTNRMEYLFKSKGNSLNVVAGRQVRPKWQYDAWIMQLLLLHLENICLWINGEQLMPMLHICHAVAVHPGPLVSYVFVYNTWWR